MKYYFKEFRSLLIIVFILFFCAAGYGFPENNENIFLIFRYDDYSSRSPTDLERKMIQDFTRHQIPLTIGIVPFIVSRSEWDPSPQELIPLSKEKILLIRPYTTSGIVTPALHGYSHQTATKDISGVGSEFRGLSDQDQFKKIKKGKEFLENRLDQNMKIFIPPWNIYDLNTLKVVEELGFTIFSAGLYSTLDKNSNLKFLPGTEDLSNLRSAVMKARSLSYSPLIIHVLFHPYDFLEIDKNRGVMSYEQFQELLEWISKQEDVTAVPLEKIAIELDMGATLFAKNRVYYKTQRLIPPFIAKQFKLISGIYLPSSVLSGFQHRTWCVLLGYSLVILLAIFLVTFSVGKYILVRYKKFTLLVYGCSLLMLVLFVLYSLKDGSLSHKGFTGILIMSSWILGLTPYKRLKNITL